MPGTMTEDEAILHLLGALLPGGAGFPPAAGTGMAPLLLARLRHADPSLPARLLAAGDGEAHEALSRMEAHDPALFAEFRKHAYLAYYEQPGAIAAIRALGHPYNDAPLPDGYPAEAFDPAHDTPRHARGRWIDTEDVRPASAWDIQP